MAMSDCIKCWETPCCCGHEYKTYPLSKLLEIYDVVKKELVSRGKLPEEENVTPPQQ
jgi:hypothetical protein